jgi:phosphocarrier protein HPr
MGEDDGRAACAVETAWLEMAGSLGRANQGEGHRQGSDVPERTAVVASKVGLHARPAAVFVKAAAEAPVPVTIRKSGSAPVSAASILSIMTLGVSHGDQVILAADGAGADAALDALVDLLETDLDASAR